jgi:HK97 family phage prohead protease
MTGVKEVRSLTLELRAEQDEQGAVITGYPIVFGQETVIGGFAREIIEPEAVSDPALLRDVALMVGHDFGMIPLAHSRRNNGSSTMQLTPDAHGVAMRAVLDVENNPKAKEAYSAVKRGDISGMSFAFTVNKESWEDLDQDMPLRRITGIDKIFEVSLVAFPAYEGTSVQAASESTALESVRASLDSAKEQAEHDRAEQAEQERRTAVLDWLNEYVEQHCSGKEEESNDV